MNRLSKGRSLIVPMGAALNALVLIGCTALPGQTTETNDAIEVEDYGAPPTVDGMCEFSDECEEDSSERERERESSESDEGWTGWGSQHGDDEHDDDHQRGCFAECDALKDAWLSRCAQSEDPDRCDEEADREVTACFESCDDDAWREDHEPDEHCDDACLERMEEAETFCEDSEDPERCYERIRRAAAECFAACEDSEYDHDRPDREERPEHDGRPDREERPEHDGRPDREDDWHHNADDLSCNERCALLREDTYVSCVEHMEDRDFCWEHATVSHEQCVMYCQEADIEEDGSRD